MANVCTAGVQEFQITFNFRFNKDVVFILGISFDTQQLHFNETMITRDEQDKGNKGDTTT